MNDLPKKYRDRVEEAARLLGPEAGAMLWAVLEGRAILPEEPKVAIEPAVKPPRSMLTLPEDYRVTNGEFASPPGFPSGAFMVTGGRIRFGTNFRVIAACGLGWDHVSVSVIGQNRTPTWEEMCYVKGLFFSAEATCVEYHPARSEYVNDHPNVLHIWRPQDAEMPKPPRRLV